MRSAPRGKCRPCSSSAPTGTMTTGSFFAIAANSSEVISSRRTRWNLREGHKWFANVDDRSTLNKVNVGSRSLFLPWPSNGRARGRPVLRREGFHLRDLSRDATGVGRDPSSLRLPGGYRLVALPHAEPAPHAPPGGGHADPLGPGDRHDGGGR